MKISEILACEPIRIETDFYYPRGFSIGDILGREVSDIDLDQAVLNGVMDGCEVRIYADESSSSQGHQSIGGLFKDNQAIVFFQTGGSWNEGDMHVLDSDAVWLLIGKMKVAEAQTYCDKIDPWDVDADIQYGLGHGIEVVDNKLNLFNARLRKETAPELSERWLHEMIVRCKLDPTTFVLSPQLKMSALSTVSSKELDWSEEREALGLPAKPTENEFQLLWSEAVKKE